MSTDLELMKYPQKDRWSTLWLAAGAILLSLSTGQFGVALAAWLAPVFLIRFLRSQKTWRGYLVLFPVMYAAFAISWHNILSFAGPLGVFLIFNVFITLLNSLTYLADRLLAPRLSGFAATLVYPLAVTTQFYLYNLVSPMGSFGTTGYEQYHNLALIQLVSVTGMWGLTLLVSWLGPVANWAWERSFSWLHIRRGLAVWSGIMVAVLLFGGLRLAFAQSPASTVRVHSFSPEKVQVAEIPDVQKDLVGYRELTQARNANLIEGAIREARRGAQIVLWPEMAGGGIEEDAKALIARAQEVAKQEGIYLAMGIKILYPDQERPWENKLVVIAPSGDVIINHDKYGATFLYSMMGAGAALQGKYALQTAQTPYGTITGGVCWDADFPMTMKQAGKHQASLILVPIGDPSGPGATLHAQMHVFRAIENGASLVRHDYDTGFSLAVDPYGRVLAMVNVSKAAEPVLVAQVPTEGVFTLYPVIGDVFAWLSVLGLVFFIGWAVISSRQYRQKKAAYAAH